MSFSFILFLWITSDSEITFYTTILFTAILLLINIIIYWVCPKEKQ